MPLAMTMRFHRRRLALAVACVGLPALVVYASLELAVRLAGFPDSGLFSDIDQTIASIASGRDDPARWKTRVYGFDQRTIEGSPAGAPGQGASTVLFVGDYVTRGFGVDLREESYPMLVGRAIGQRTPVRVLNAAVEGFGVSQMLCKLEDLVPRHRPQMVVFAYIPHDLWRAARDVNFGYVQPVLWVDPSRGIEVLVPFPADPRGFYEGYSSARRHGYLGLWSLRHFVRNRLYYFPRVYHERYRRMYGAIAARLTTLAEQYGAKVLVVRLASTWPGEPVRFLDDIARELFTRASDPPRQLFFDTEDCARAECAARGVEFAEMFRYHPTPLGHSIYASCLVAPLEALLSSGESRPAGRSRAGLPR